MKKNVLHMNHMIHACYDLNLATAVELETERVAFPTVTGPLAATVDVLGATGLPWICRGYGGGQPPPEHPLLRSSLHVRLSLNIRQI